MILEQLHADDYKPTSLFPCTYFFYSSINQAEKVHIKHTLV